MYTFVSTFEKLIKLTTEGSTWTDMTILDYLKINFDKIVLI